MSRTDRFAILLSLLGVLASALVADLVFERMPHIEDEIAYVWQARLMAAGKLTILTPPDAKSFLVPFVVDYNGQRFGKYPLGWPVVLALGERLGLRFLVNPLLAGLGVWLTYLLGKRVFTDKVGLLAAGLTVSSPFFLMNSGSLLSHPLGLVLSSVFALAWVDGFTDRAASPRWLPTLGAGLALGGLALTRPFTAVAVGFPFALHGVYLFVRGDRRIKTHLIVLGLVAGAVSCLHLLWQYLATGHPFLNLYTLWWDYDKVGFGPGHGHRPEGHTLDMAFLNTGYSLLIGAQDLFGWWYISWIFIPFGVWAARKNRKALLLGSVFPSLVLFYMAYWIGAFLFGPRYFYEGFYSLTLLSATGIAYLAGWQYPYLLEESETPPQAAARRFGWMSRLRLKMPRMTERLSRSWQKLICDPKRRQALVIGLVGVLLVYNLAVFLPYRMRGMYGLYDMSRSDIVPFFTPQAQALTPALIIVHPGAHWMPYGVLLDLEDPSLTTPFIFAISGGPTADKALAGDFPDRKVFHYYPVDEPQRFYTGPRPEK
jgi:hypothetical protein